MKRYFTFTTPPDPTVFRPSGFYHWIELPSGGHVCVVAEEGTIVPAEWVELPHLLEQTGAGLNDHGCDPTDSMFATARKLAKIHQAFKP